MDHFKELRALDSFEHCAIFGVGEGRVSHESMRLILGCPAYMKLDIMCRPAPNFTVDFPIPCNYLVVHYGSWVKLHMLLNLNCQAVKLLKCTLTENDLNQFLHFWMNSDNHKLYHITVCNLNGAWDFAKIVTGLPTFPGSPKRQEASSYQDQHVTYENGLDFRRPTDGMLGTVIKSDKNEFLFVAWHVADPNLP